MIISDAPNCGVITYDHNWRQKLRLGSSIMIVSSFIVQTNVITIKNYDHKTFIIQATGWSTPPCQPPSSLYISTRLKRSSTMSRWPRPLTLNQSEMLMGYSGGKNLARGSQKGVCFANATTFSTWVRVRLPKDVCQCHQSTNPAINCFVTNYNPRLKIRARSGPVLSLSCTQTVAKFSHHLTTDFLKDLVQYACTNLPNEEVTEHFVILSPDQLLLSPPDEPSSMSIDKGHRVWAIPEEKIWQEVFLLPMWWHFQPELELGCSKTFVDVTSLPTLPSAALLQIITPGQNSRSGLAVDQFCP